MADGGDDSRDPIRCGDCLEEEGYLLNPKVTPCSHIFCEECIRGHLKKTDVFTCKICKAESRFVVEELPSALTHPTFCDICEKKGKKNMTAKAYCVLCKRKYCGRHEEAHRDVSEHHTVLTIEKFLKSEFAMEQKFCDKHEDQHLQIGCTVCWTMYCMKCVCSLDSCQNGGSHNLIPLAELSSVLKEKMEPQTKKAEEKFTEWTALIDMVSESLENWGKETEEGLRLIDESENKQLSALKEKYAKIRADYVKFRNENKEKITSYIDGDARVKFTQFQTEMKSLKETISSYHAADLVARKNDMEMSVGSLVTADFPTLILKNQRKLSVTDERRETEIMLISSEDLVIHRSENRRNPPTAIQLIKQVTVRPDCTTVCHYKGYVYVGFGSSVAAIDRIDEEGQVTIRFIKLTGAIITVRGHNDQLFILMHGKPYKVYVYDLTGTLIRSWDHGDKSSNYPGNKMVFIKDNLILPDISNRRISVYTTAGNTIKQIPCPAISADTETAMCAGGDNCVIVSHVSPPRVHKFNLTSGAIEWTSDKITKPLCVEYSPHVVLVSGDYSTNTRVWVLDYNTGDLLRELSDERTMLSEVLDLSVFGDVLLIPRYHEKAVLFYKIGQEDEQLCPETWE